MRMMIRNEILELLFWAWRNKSLSECLIPYVTMTMLKVITMTMLKVTIRHDDDDAGAGGCDDYDSVIVKNCQALETLTFRRASITVLAVT